MAVVDDAIVAFLATQPESRFDITMRLALPFTAVNPRACRVR